VVHEIVNAMFKGLLKAASCKSSEIQPKAKN